MEQCWEQTSTHLAQGVGAHTDFFFPSLLYNNEEFLECMQRFNISLLIQDKNYVRGNSLPNFKT